MERKSWRFSAIIIIFLLPLTVLAQDTKSGLKFDPADNTGGGSIIVDGKSVTPKDKLTTIQRLTFLSGADDPFTITVSLINLALTTLGTISLVLMLYAGFLWFKAGDNEEAIEQAKDIIKGAVIGLVLTLGAYSFGVFIFSQLDYAVRNGTPTDSAPVDDSDEVTV